MYFQLSLLAEISNNQQLYKSASAGYFPRDVLQHEVVYKSAAAKSGTLLFITGIIMYQQGSCMLMFGMSPLWVAYFQTYRKKKTTLFNSDQIHCMTQFFLNISHFSMF